MRRKNPNPLPRLQHLRLSLLFASADSAGLRRTNLLAGMMISREIGLNRARLPRGDGAEADLDVEEAAGRAVVAHRTSRSSPSIRRGT